MIFAEIAAFFLLVCTTDAGAVDQKCLRQMNECFIHYAMESKQTLWDIAERCSEETEVGFN